MSLWLIVLGSAVIFLVAYRFYGGLLSRLLRLDKDAPTPAVTLRDDVDYSPIEPKFLLSQHFSAIAAAGPITGPILAGVMFGWAPALIWIILGSIFIGGVHDMGALVASVRHKARSIADVVREHMSRRAYILFLAFIWIALVYIIVAFTDIVADSFVGPQKLADDTTLTGGATATSSLLYLLLPVVMGLLLRYAKTPLWLATVIFLPLIGVAVWAGPHIPFDLDKLLGISDANAHRTWDVLLLLYCFIASVVPMWLLLQPRGHLGGYFLIIVLLGGVIGALFGGKTATYPAFKGWDANYRGIPMPLAPMLFITVACGACSGFHAIIASGTTSKQLRRETDAKSVGYGSMLLEGMVAVLSLCTVMVLAAGSTDTEPNVIYAKGLSQLFAVFGVPVVFAFTFTLLAFTTFVYDTLDVCTRLGRYILQELLGWQGRAGRLAATAATIVVPLFFLLLQPVTADGKIVPAWRTYWWLFGASNQLLAALTLIGVTVWLWRRYHAVWVWLVMGLPTVFMYVMSIWSLARFIRDGFFNADGSYRGVPTTVVPWAAVILVVLALLVLVEAVRVFMGRQPPTEGRPEPAPAVL